MPDANFPVHEQQTVENFATLITCILLIFIILSEPGGWVPGDESK